MALIKGKSITLYEKTQTGTDGFGAPVYRETTATVDNVLIRPISEDDATETTDMHGKKIEYELCIPKGDQHIWTDRKVSFFGQTYQTVGKPIELIEDMVPLDWNKKIKVESYE